MGVSNGRDLVLKLDRFIGNSDDFRFQQGMGKVRHRGKVQVSKKDLPFPEQRVFGGKRLFHLNDHLALRKTSLAESTISPPEANILHP